MVIVLFNVGYIINQKTGFNVYQVQEITTEVRRAAGRRKKLLIITPILMVMLSIAALYVIEPKYSSSTTILVQKEETLNPLILYEMAVTMASEDRLQTFNEVVYSRSAVEMLVEELDLREEEKFERLSRTELVERIRSMIGTRNNSSDAFEITFYHHNPEKAQKGAELLADYFIDSRLKMEIRRNRETVDFFQSRVDELQEIVQMSRDEMLGETQRRVQEVPGDVGSIQADLRDAERRIEELDWEIYQKEENLEKVERFLDQGEGNYDFGILYNLPLSEMPFGDDLRTHLEEYDELSASYTESYPSVRRASEQIVETTSRIPSALNTNLSRMERQRNQLAETRVKLLNKLESSYVASRQEESRRSDFSVYESLYNEMTTKLEQAKVTRDLSERASDNFVVLDAAVVPDKPVSPNNKLVIAAGLFIGVFLGVMFAGIAEAMDTTVRSLERVKYQKPIIAYISYE